MANRTRWHNSLCSVCRMRMPFAGSKCYPCHTAHKAGLPTLPPDLIQPLLASRLSPEVTAIIAPAVVPPPKDRTGPPSLPVPMRSAPFWVWAVGSLAMVLCALWSQNTPKSTSQSVPSSPPLAAHSAEPAPAIPADVRSRPPVSVARVPPPARFVNPSAPIGTNYYSRYYDNSYRPPVGEHYVHGYYRRDGTYVTGHYRTNPDNSFWNNWSSQGNINPYTGRVGTKQPPHHRRR
jgi:hypothetical protein